MDSVKDVASGSQVPAIVRATQIIDALADSAQPMGTSELARLLKLPKSSVHLICSTMINLGLLVRRGENRFSIGPHVLHWAESFQASSDLVREFQQLTSETAVLPELALNLTVLMGRDVLYVGCRNGQQPLGVRFGVGVVLPAIFTATGKAMLSTKPFGEVVDFVGKTWPAPYTRRSVQTLDHLQVELEATRVRGYSIDDGQLREGMYCLAAPIFDSTSTAAIAGIAVGLLQSEITVENEARIASELISFANTLSLRLGGRIPV